MRKPEQEREVVLSEHEVEKAYQEGLFDYVLDGTLSKYTKELEGNAEKRIARLRKKLRAFQDPVRNVEWLVNNDFLRIEKEGEGGEGNTYDISLEDYVALRRFYKTFREKERAYEKLRKQFQSLSEERREGKREKLETLERELERLRTILEKVNAFLRERGRVKRGEEEIKSAIERIQSSTERIRRRMESFIQILKDADEEYYDYIAQDRDEQIADAMRRVDKTIQRALGNESGFEYALFSFAKENGESLEEVLEKLKKGDKSFVRKIRGYLTRAVESGKLSVEDLIAWGKNYGYHKALLGRLQKGEAIDILRFAAEELDDEFAEKLLRERSFPFYLWKAYKKIAGNKDAWIRSKFPYLYENYQKRVREGRRGRKTKE